jgi:hypothetical protein
MIRWQREREREREGEGEGEGERARGRGRERESEREREREREREPQIHEWKTSIWPDCTLSNLTHRFNRADSVESANWKPFPHDMQGSNLAYTRATHNVLA